MSGLSPFSPSQTKAIWFPSGEKAAWVSPPGKLVKGMIFKGGTGDLVPERNNITQTATLTTSPRARKAADQLSRLADDRGRPEGMPRLTVPLCDCKPVPCPARSP